MTTQFTTSCYIKIDDAQQRKEVCDKLKLIGYLLLSPPCKEDYRFSVRLNFAYLYVDSRCSVPIYDLSNHKPSYIPVIDCDTNIELFLDLAGMRKDTDNEQWFIESRKNHKDKFMKCACNKAPKSTPSITIRKMTATEIINHHKQKGEKE